MSPNADPVMSVHRPWTVCLGMDAGEEALLAGTLDAALVHGVGDAPLLLIARDAARLGAQFASPRVRPVQIGSGPTNPLHAAMAQVQGDSEAGDLAFLSPGVWVPARWDQRLHLAATRDEGIGAVSPLCDAATLFRLLEPGQQADPDMADRLAWALGRRCSVQIPAILCGCLYLRRSALESVWPDLSARGGLPLGEFAMSLARELSLRGWCNVLCDHLYVADCNPAHAAAMAPLATWPAVVDVERIHPLTGLRHTANDALARGLAQDLTAAVNCPVQLHVVHCWGGGIERWLTDFWMADRGRRNLILRSVGIPGMPGQAIGLYESPHMARPLRYWELGYPIRATALGHLQYRAILREVIGEFGVEALLVSSLIGHSLDVLETELPTALVAHDYYPFCPALNIYYDGVCTSCDGPRLESCFSGNPHNRFFTPTPAADWLALRQRFQDLLLNRDIALVAPSASVPRHLCALMPALSRRRYTLIPHGLRLAGSGGQPAAAPDGKRLRLVVLGSLAPHKGRDLLRQALPAIRSLAELYLVGCGEEGEIFAGEPGVRIISRYDYPQLPGIIAGIAPDAGLLLSILPETFSYTLSELQALGIPPVVTRVGSFADRITDGENGFLVEPRVAALVARLQWLRAQPQALQQVRRRLQAMPQPSPEDMVAGYHRLLPLPEFTPNRYARPCVRPVVDAGAAVGVLAIAPQARYAEALRDFWRYTIAKLIATPRLKHWQKQAVLALFHSSARMVARLGGRERSAGSGLKEK